MSIPNTNYIDGFVFPIAHDDLQEYRRLATEIAEIWKGYGALDYCEFVGDDMLMEGTCSFTDLVKVKEGEVIVFGWVEFESRAARDQVNKQVAADPRVLALMDKSNTSFDAARMAYAGFKPLIRLPK